MGGDFLRLGLNRHIHIRILPAHTQPMWQSVNKILVMCLVVASFSMGFAYYHTKINPLIVSLAKKRSSQIVVTTINRVVNDYMTDNNIGYDDLADINRGEDGQIKAIFLNTNAINKLKATLALNVQSELEKIKSAEIKIPLGAILDVPFLAGAGPMINIELVPIGCALVDFESSFSSAGINQTKHQIDIIINADFGMILSAGSENISIKANVPTVQTIIIGEVPNGIITPYSYGQ